MGITVCLIYDMPPYSLHVGKQLYAAVTAGCPDVNTLEESTGV